jgi:hypothetical protein
MGFRSQSTFPSESLKQNGRAISGAAIWLVVHGAS